MSDRTLIKPLTSIRFFAAMFVVMYHSGATFIAAQAHIPSIVKSFFMNGYTGVTFFFVLSGFILHITYRGKLNDTHGIRKFAVARLARIYPVYILTLLLMIPFAWMNHDWRDIPQFLLLHWWITAPWPILGIWNGPSWTISVEMFFYLCFPWVARWASRLSARSIWAALVALMVIDFVTGSSAFFSLHPTYFYWLRWVPSPIVRLPEFIIGVLVGELHFRRGERTFAIPPSVPVISLICLLCVSHRPWVASAVTMMTAMMIAAIAADRGSMIGRGLQQRWIVLLGAASYSLYLLQQPLHFYMVWLFGPSRWLVPLQYCGVVVSSIVVFLYFEEPARERIRSLGRLKPSVIEEVADSPAHLKTPWARPVDADSPTP